MRYAFRAILIFAILGILGWSWQAWRELSQRYYFDPQHPGVQIKIPHSIVGDKNCAGYRKFLRSQIPDLTLDPVCPWERSEALVLDLDNEGLKLVPLEESRIFFDIDNDTFAERTSWLQGSDGFLAQDFNGNGSIDNQSELYGDNDGISGYEKLALLDSNLDGVIDSGDTKFAELRVWQDINRDGRTNSGELKTLAEAGIESLTTRPVETQETINRHLISASSNFKRTNGSSGRVISVFFHLDQKDSWFVGDGTRESVKIDPGVVFLPASRGYGILPGLIHAYTWNPSLREKGLELMSISARELNPTIATQKVEAFMYEWAEVVNVDPSGRGPLIDGRKLAFLEKFMGVPFTNVGGYSYPRTKNQAGLLMFSWEQIYTMMEQRLLIQGPLAPIMGARYDFQTDDLVFKIGFQDILKNIQDAAPTGAEAKLGYARIIERAMTGLHTRFNIAPEDMRRAIQLAAGVPVQ